MSVDQVKKFPNLPAEKRFTCSCKNNFGGRLCELEPCQHKPDICQNGGKCKMHGDKNSQIPRTWSCECTAGFTGKNCLQDINECELGDPCTNYYQKCVNTYGSYQCVQECDMTNGKNPCYNGGVCSPLHQGNFKCLCKEKYEGELCQTPVNFCQKNKIVCQNGGQCSNDYSGLGKGVCQCKNDNFGGEFCEKSCENLCQNGGKCFLGECQCDPNFYGKFCQKSLKTTTQPVLSTVNTRRNNKNNRCTPDLCQNGATCHNTLKHGQPSFQCSCPTGFIGTFCETNFSYRNSTNPCETHNPCNFMSSRGHCQLDDQGAPFCSCDNGWTGPECLVRSNPCDDHNQCRIKSQCSPSWRNIDDIYCKCEGDWFGSTCHKSYVKCGSGNCYNGGICTKYNNQPTCQCTDPTTYGQFCEYKKPDKSVKKPIPEGYEYCDMSLNCNLLAADGHCDPQCNTANCNFDGFDCMQESFQILDSATNTFCNLNYNNGVCDEKCNNTFAGFDGEDCLAPKFSSDRVKLEIGLPIHELVDKKIELERSLTAATWQLVKLEIIELKSETGRTKREVLGSSGVYGGVFEKIRQFGHVGDPHFT